MSDDVSRHLQRQLESSGHMQTSLEPSQAAYGDVALGRLGTPVEISGDLWRQLATSGEPRRPSEIVRPQHISFGCVSESSDMFDHVGSSLPCSLLSKSVSLRSVLVKFLPKREHHFGRSGPDLEGPRDGPKRPKVAQGGSKSHAKS